MGVLMDSRLLTCLLQVIVGLQPNVPNLSYFPRLSSTNLINSQDTGLKPNVPILSYFPRLSFRRNILPCRSSPGIVHEQDILYLISFNRLLTGIPPASPHIESFHPDGDRGVKRYPCLLSSSSYGEASYILFSSALPLLRKLRAHRTPPPPPPPTPPATENSSVMPRPPPSPASPRSATPRFSPTA